MEATREIDAKAEALERELKSKQRLTEDILNGVATAEKKIADNKNRMTQLRAEYAEIAGKSANVTDTCPTCGQALPKDQVDVAIKKHNERQAQQLAEINGAGKNLKKFNEKLTTEIKEATKQGTANDTAIKDLQAQIAKLKSTSIDVPFDTSKIDKVKAEIQTIEKQIADNLPPDTKSLEDKRAAFQRQLAEIDMNKRTRGRIVELVEEEKMLATEYEELEHQISLMEKFTVSKVNLLEAKINSKFSLARFKLFRTQINQGIEECCETLYEGVPYSTGLNTGAQINVGLDIVKTLSEHYGIKAPIFIDHAESVTEILDPGTQTIKLMVSDKHETMEVTNV